MIAGLTRPREVSGDLVPREQGIYANLPFEQYIADALAIDPSLNAGTAARLIAECPRSAWFHHARLNPTGPGKKSPAMDAGSIAHEILLEGSAARVAVIDPEEHRSKPTKENPEGSIPDGWTNKAIREARDLARAAGKIPILKADFADIEAMVESAETFIRGSEIADIFAESERELTLLWEESGVWLRCRPDALHARRIVVDAKTTERSADPEKWARSQIPGHNEIQAALGLRGLRCLAPGAGDRKHVWLVIEQQAPFLCSLVAPDPAMLALADAKLEAAIAIWRRCIAANEWPGYPSRICYAAPQAYQQAQWEERAVQEIEENGL